MLILNLQKIFYLFANLILQLNKETYKLFSPDLDQLKVYKLFEIGRQGKVYNMDSFNFRILQLAKKHI
jgi:hypothetical protein